MALHFLSSCVLVALGGLTPAPQEPAERPPSKVLIDFVAVDRKGVPVADLKADDIEVWIGHFRVPIHSLTLVRSSAGEQPGRTIILMLDDITLEPAMIARARETARRFVRAMQPGDRIGIAKLSGDVTDTTDDQTRLLKALDAYTPRASGVIRFDVFSEHVIGTITDLSRELAEAPGRRRTIVGIGPGSVFDKPFPPPTIGADLNPQWVQAIRAMAFAHASLYVIDPSGVGERRTDLGDYGFARDTGGRAFLSTNDLNGAVDQILRDASTYYVAAVSDPPVGRKADLREMEVRILRKGVTARFKRTIPGGA